VLRSSGQRTVGSGRELQAPGVPLDAEQTIAWLRGLIAVFGLALLGSTNGLWWPVGDFPVVPWIDFGGPLALDHALAWALVLSWLGVLAATVLQMPSLIRASSIISILSLTGCILLDQHRLQVWAWEFLWLQVFLTFGQPQAALLSSRLLVVGIYFYSAVSKLDAGFVQTQGPWLWQGLSRAMGLASIPWGAKASSLYLAFPLGELLVAGALVLRRSRRWGIGLSVGMHIILLLALGPWGWQQRPGVLLWNLFFLGSVPLLFWRTEPFEPEVTAGSPQSRKLLSNEFCLLAAIALGIWPALEGIQLCDHWPAWAVYSSRPEIVRIDIRENDVSRLPNSLHPHVGPAEALSDWRPVSIDQWSFEERGCPIYPQGRYRLAIARTLETRYGVQLRVTEQATPSRWTGQRELREVTDLSEECNRRYWFSTRAREVARPLVVPGWGDRVIALTAQFAVIGYLMTLLLAARRTGECPSKAEASLWTLGCAGLAVHVIAAFHYLHHWDHSAALRHTAQRTAEVTGWHWSGGLYINYLFLAFWLVDVIRVWLEAIQLRAPAGRPWRRFVQGVFAFMMFNATVVFGPVHWVVAAVVFGVLYRVQRSRAEG
jgi:hypothetical protein